MNEEIFIHRQTLSNATRYVTGEIIEIQNNLNQCQQKSLEKELDIFSNLLKLLEKDIPIIKETIHSIALLDVYSNLSFIAKKYNLAKPTITNNQELEIISGFHPMVKNNLPEGIHEFTTNNCTLQNKQSLWLVTGPNMAGKSTFLRQNALIIILAHIGSFVPAKSAMIGIVDKIFSRVGASDDLSRGRSTFMVEMLETATIMNNATKKSFLILDEIGRGTATFDGMSLAFAITEYIHDQIGARTLFATHYHELSELSNKLKNCACYYSKVSEDGDKIVFTHKIVAGIAGKSYGIAVASLAGLPAKIISRAGDIIQKLERNNKTNNTLQLPLFNESNHNHENDNKINLNQQSHRNKSTSNNDLTPLANKKYEECFENLKNLDIDGMSPKEALNILYEYQSKIK